MSDMDLEGDGILFRSEGDPSSRSILRRAAERTESMVGFIFQCLFTLTIGFLAVATGIEQTIMLHPMAVIALLSAFLWICYDLPYLWHTWRINYDGGRPLFVASALRQRLVPMGLRPIVGLWWLAHFAFVGVGLVMNAAATQGRSGGRLFGFFVLAFLLSFAANGYLVQFTATFTRSRKVLLRVWSIRFLLDVGVAIVAAVFARAS